MDKKETLRKTECLYQLGGLIKDYIDNLLHQEYDPSIVSAITRRMKIGEGVIPVIEALNEEKIIFDNHCTGYQLPDNENSIDKDDLSEWYIDQSARLICAKNGRHEGYFWQSWDLEPRIRRRLINLGKVEERILLLSIETDKNGKTRNAGDISELPEFGCDEKYIEYVINMMDHYFRGSHGSIDYNYIKNELMKHYADARIKEKEIVKNE